MKLVLFIVAIFISAQLIFAAQPAQADPAEREFQNPPLLEFREQPTAPLNPQSALTTGAPKEFDLNIQYTNSKLYNPATATYDQVRLRSYVGSDTNPDRPYVAPLIEVNPGETVRVNLNNELPADPSCEDGDRDRNINDPHCFNGTNLHTHGLWVSPTGNSDNVLLSINPGVKFQYEFNLPHDHPAGTFWYHPHRHGSTALQVSSGMVGALIVRGNRLPSEKAHGDIDTLLKRQNGTDIPERVLVLQQIQYACLDEEGAIKVQKNNEDKVIAWVCDPNDMGVIEAYENFGPGTWDQSGRYTSINGSILPTVSAKAGEIERWRLIHAGVRDTINLEFRKAKPGAPSLDTLKARDIDSYIDKYCTGAKIPYHVIADDGLTRAQAWETKLTTLQPGYRNDALVVFPEAGKYCGVDTPSPPEGNVSGGETRPQLLGIVDVQAGEEVPENIHEYLTKQLILAARRHMPEPIKPRVIDDLNNDLKLTEFTPHLNINFTEITGKQELAFYIYTTPSPAKFEVSNHIGAESTPKPYVHDRIDRELTLGGVEEWTLESRFVGHPFHIHVNPFQIVKILDPDGNDVSLPDAKDGRDPQYRGLKGVWKDTLWIKGPSPGPDGALPPYPQGVYTVVARTRYQRYIGEFVLHCHILDHEDQGMMQNVSIVLPNDVGGNTVSHH